MKLLLSLALLLPACSWSRTEELYRHGPIMARNVERFSIPPRVTDEHMSLQDGSGREYEWARQEKAESGWLAALWAAGGAIVGRIWGP